MHSPGAPSLRREVERQFWVQIATGITSEKAAEAAGVRMGPIGRNSSGSSSVVGASTAAADPAETLLGFGAVPKSLSIDMKDLRMVDRAQYLDFTNKSRERVASARAVGGREELHRHLGATHAILALNDAGRRRPCDLF